MRTADLVSAQILARARAFLFAKWLNRQPFSPNINVELRPEIIGAISEI